MKQIALAACEEMKSCVVCPKPRRLGLINLASIEPIRPLRRHFSYQQEVDAKAGAELLDLIVSKGGYGSDQTCTQIASSPPFFCGSPPSRVSNPLIKDAQFRDEKFTPISPRAAIPIPIPSGLLSSASPNSSAARKSGGCVRANFGNNPAVRVEGFDCLDRDGGNCSIPALA